jgi:hypothetical protein
MTLGRSPTEEDVFRSSTDFCRERVPAASIYGLLHREGHRLFPDEAFADLFKDIGRASVPPRIVAVVMVLQRLEGLSDREAVDRHFSRKLCPRSVFLGFESGLKHDVQRVEGLCDGC